MSVGIGTAIVSYMEPEPGYEREFNAWYERDHFIATVRAGPGVFASGRFVATRECKARRQGTFFGDPARGSYLSIAWVLPGKQPEWDEWVAREMDTITAEGRLFPHREHMHTGVYRFERAEGDLPATFVFDRAPANVVAAANTSGGMSFDGASAVITLRSERTIVSAVDPPDHDLVLAFSPDAIAFTGNAGYVSPFVATVPGTDTYTEDL